MKYYITFCMEFINSFPTRKHIQSLGAKDGSFHALYLWCQSFASYCVRNKIPWSVCLRPWTFENYMMGPWNSKQKKEAK